MFLAGFRGFGAVSDPDDLFSTSGGFSGGSRTLWRLRAGSGHRWPRGGWRRSPRARCCSPAPDRPGRRRLEPDLETPRPIIAQPAQEVGHRGVFTSVAELPHIAQQPPRRQLRTGGDPPAKTPLVRLNQLRTDYNSGPRDPVSGIFGPSCGPGRSCARSC